MKAIVGIPVILVATGLLFAYLTFIWWLDRYEREPFWMVALVFLWGATIGIGCGCALNSTVLLPVKAVLGAAGAMSIGAILVAPVIEEITKGLVFVPLVLTDHFDNETDGLIYGAATGLGFAMVENIMYFIKFVSSPKMGLAALIFAMAIRTLFTAVMHCISSSLLGMSIGYARHRSGNLKWLLYPGIGYLLAVANHALWNTASVMSNYHAGFQLAGVGMVIVASGVLFGLTQWSLKREHDVIRDYLHQEAQRGTLPAEHADIIPYWRRRRKKDWLASHVDRDAYIEAATLLAFRQHQLAIAQGERRDEYLKEIEKYRHQIRDLLAGSATKPA